MPSKKQQTSSTNPINQPDLSNYFYLLHLNIQKLTKEVQDLKQITQSLMLTINQVLNQQNPQKQQNQPTSSQEMEIQVTQIEWNLRQKFDQRINQLEQIQLNQRSDPESREGRIRPSPIRKQKEDVDTVKNMDIRQTNAIDAREHNIMEQKEDLKIYLKSIAHQMENSIQKKFQPYLEAPKINTHGDNLRYDKQDLISKQQQEDKISDLQESIIQKNQMNSTSKISDKKKLLQALIL